MAQATPIITVVPGSATGRLAGLAGKHSYDFDYTLPATK
jgi:hypothetical protein